MDAHPTKPPAARSLRGVSVVIPALNEERSIAHVVAAVPRGVGQVIVVDNGSTDRTAAVAQQAGATVVHEPRRGYGAACLAGIAALADDCEVVAFLDADFADDPGLLPKLVGPILDDEADLVIGSRSRGSAERGSLTLPQRLGNHVATAMLGILCGARFTDLGPFRAVRRRGLDRLAMDDATYGWTVQMQVRAVRQRLRCREIAVPYRRRIGQSKISGTLRGVLGAGVKIPLTILREVAWPPRHLPAPAPPEQVIVFARRPEPGKTKTRLIPALGPEGAAELHHRMALHTLGEVSRFTRHRPAAVASVRSTGGTAAQMAEVFGPRRYREQGAGNLGDRLHRAAADAFADGASRVVFIGTDCPAVTADHLRRAFDTLRHEDLVIGPAIDGGYYLLGMRRLIPALFDDIDWGTGDVLAQTLAAARRVGATVTLLDTLADVDRPEDLDACRAALDGPRISVIVPTLNEEANLAATLRRLRAGADAGVQIIVADGGSRDATVRIARDHGARVVESRAGRPRQMNAGAAVATGDVLLFCHADTHLPRDYARLIREAVADEQVVGGAFELRIDAPGRVYRLIERAVRFRCRRLHLPYGDQGIFIRRSAFDTLGGFDASLSVMEDYHLVRRLRRLGTIVSLPTAARTDARYWQRHGPIRATLRNQLVVAAHAVGLQPATLRRWRHARRG